MNNSPGETVVTIAAFALIIIGLLQYVVAFMKSADKKRGELFDQLEETRTKLNKLQVDYDDLIADMKKIKVYTQRLERYATQLKKNNAKLKDDLMSCIGTLDIDE